MASNVLSVSTKHALVDTGASAYVIVSRTFAARLEKLLQLDVNDHLDPGHVTGFDRKNTQAITKALCGILIVQQHTHLNEWMLVLDTPHDLILGRKWLSQWDILPDCRRRRLLYPENSLVDPAYWKTIEMDTAGDLPSSPEFEKDVREREIAMEREDRRRREGREFQKAIQARVDELEELQREAAEPPPTKQDRPWRPQQILQRSQRRLQEPPRSAVDKEIESIRADLRAEEGESEDKPAPHRTAKPRSTDPYPLQDSQGPYRLARGWSWFKE